MDYALSFNICYCSRILNSRENLQRNSDAFSRFTLLLAPSPDVHSDSPPCKQYHPKLPCSNWFLFFTEGIRRWELPFRLPHHACLRKRPLKDSPPFLFPERRWKTDIRVSI